MIEQLWYTWSTVGLGSVTGYRVRATSAGLSDIRSESVKELEQYLYYDLPTGADPYKVTKDTAPICLSLVSPISQKSKRIALYKTYVGKDAYGRAGVFFVHVLYGVPDTFTARNVIDLWGSAFWQYADDLQHGLDLRLVQAEQLPVGKDLKASRLQEAQEDLVFLIQAFLSLKDDQHLYVAAPAKDVAALIWGLLHCLPPSLQKNVTFSTYERDVRALEARIIGTEWLDSTAQDLPKECYNELVLNCYAPEKNSVLVHQQSAAIKEYAEFAAHCLIHQQQSRLDALFNIAEKNQSTDLDKFLLSYKLFVAQNLSPTDILVLLQNPHQAAHWLSQAENQQIVIELVQTQQQWWQMYGEQAFRQLYSHMSSELAQGLSVFTRNITSRAIQSLLYQEEANVAACLNIIHAIAPPAHNSEPWRRILHEVQKNIPPQQPLYQLCSWRTYTWLLKQWAMLAVFIQDGDIFPWVMLPWEKLADFLDVELSPNPYKPFLDWHILAAAYCIENRDKDLAAPLAIALVTKHQTIFEKALQRLISSDEQTLQHLMPSTEQTRKHAVGFVSWIIKEGYSNKLKMVAVLLATGKMESLESDTLLQRCKLQEAEKVAFIEQYGSKILTGSASLSPEALKCVDAFALSLNVEKLQKPGIKALLALLWEKHIENTRQQEVFDWLQVAEIISPSRFTDPKLPTPLTILDGSTERLKLHQDTIYTRLLLQRAVDCIHSQEELLNFLQTFDHLYSNPDENDYLLQKLITVLAENYTARNPPPVLLQLHYIAATLRYVTKTMPDKSIRGQFLKKAFAVLLKNVERDNAFETFDDNIQKWPEDYQKLWSQYGSNLRPKKLLDKIPFVKRPATGALSLEEVPQNPKQQQGEWIAKKGDLVLDLDVFERIHVLKHIYIPFRLAELNTIKKSSKDEIKKSRAKDEIKFLNYHKDKKDSIQATINIFVRDVAVTIDLYERDKNIVDEMKRNFHRILGNLKESKEYKTISTGPFLKHLVKDDYLEEVVLIFLRCKYCYEKSLATQDWHALPAPIQGVKQNDELLEQLKKSHEKSLKKFY